VILPGVNCVRATAAAEQQQQRSNSISNQSSNMHEQATSFNYVAVSPRSLG